MIRTLSLLVLAALLAGCSQYRAPDRGSRAQGPFGKPTKEPPPPYGSLPQTVPTSARASDPHPVGNLSPLDIAAAAPAPPLPPDEPSLIPSKSSAPVVPASRTAPALDADADASASALPPFRRRQPPAPLPSPFAPKPEPPKPAETPGANAPASPKDKKNLAELKALVAAAGAAWKATDTYEVVATRRELTPKGHVNNDVTFVQYRREPMSVFVRTTSGTGKGREVVYNPGKFGDKLHAMLGEGDSKLAKAGFIAPPIAPDDPKVLEKTRYSMREAGFGRPIEALKTAVAKLEAGKLPADALTFDGELKRDEFAHPVVGVTHKLRPAEDPLMPLGGTRLYFFDMRKDSPAYGLPVLVLATDAVGREHEYYLFEKMKRPANLTDAHFDPARLGKK